MGFCSETAFIYYAWQRFHKRCIYKLCNVRW